MVIFETFPNRRQRTLSNASITDAGLEIIAALPKLEALSLAYAAVSDTGMKHLQGMTRLRVLYLRGTNVTNVGLALLKNLRSLERLTTPDTFTPYPTVAEIRAAVPAVKVNQGLVLPITIQTNSVQSDITIQVQPFDGAATGSTARQGITIEPPEE